MDFDWLIREEMLIGKEALEALSKAHVLVVGIGGVGGFATECLARAGISHLTLVDGDCVEPSNKNRQLVALDSTNGQNKAAVMKRRILDINPNAQIDVIEEYLSEESMRTLLKNRFDYVLDAIDTLAPKVSLIQTAVENGLPVVSSMGAGGKLDPSRIQSSDVSKSYNCTLAKALRKRLNRLGIRKGVQVVFSPEEVDKSLLSITDGSRNKKSVIGTISWMPPLFGAHCASVVVRSLLQPHEASASSEN